MPPPALERVRRICLALPEAHEVEAWEAPTFRVRNKLFAIYSEPEDRNDRPSIWLKSTHVNQDLLIQLDSSRFFRPPYVGPSGWIGAYVDKRPDWKLLADLLCDAWCLTAPRKLVKSFMPG